MKTLDDAWRWYTDVKKSLQHMNRIGDRCWDHLPWNTFPWQGDRHFIDLTKEAVTGAAQFGLEHLDDLAVVVLFSVFEAIVRGVILEQIKAEKTEYRHPAILEAIKNAEDRIGEGSFYAALAPYRKANAVFLSDIDQVRRYRNWVSHGKRNEQPALVSPLVAYERLKKCLGFLFPEIPEEWLRVAAFYEWEAETASPGKDEVHWSKAKVKLQDMVRSGELNL